MTGGTLTSKIFATLREATEFAIYQVSYGNVHSVDKI